MLLGKTGVLAAWASRHRMLSKVPEIVVLFWVTKILTTGMGEATSDYLVAINRYGAVLVGLVAFALALTWQLWLHRYVVGVYWLAVSMVAVFGTMAADVLHIGLGIPYAISSAFYAVVLAAVFVTWQRTEGTLSIHSIHTPRRELFYWATVLATFALGTALGDMTAATLQLGYLDSGFLFAGLFLAPALGYWKLGLDPIVAFWFAYVMTRPLGASFADWLDKSGRLGGLGLGNGPVAAASALVIVCFVAYLAITHDPLVEQDDALRVQ
ncbi:MAG: hypothetical protein ABSC56_04525 [Solirubrobacteraceae bacterium]